MPVGIEATVAGFRNLPTSVPVKNSVVIFWESHTKNPEDKSKVQSTIDLIPKKFDLSTCENYEVRTGYLSRYNYLSKPKENSQIEELEDAIVKGEEEQLEWIKRCNPNLEGFTQINWQECVSKLKNPKFRDCKDLLMKTIVEDVAIKKAYKESARVYAAKRKTNEQNGFSYLVEENAWILSLPYLYSNKYIYVIHVGNVTEATTLLWSSFEYLRESVRLLFPYFSKQKFSNLADFRSEYENKRNLGYFIDDECFKNVINCKYVKKEDLSKESLLKLLVDERSEKEILTNIIANMPGHVYWLNKRYYFMGCNNVQARDLGLNSRHEIIGKTIFDLLPKAEAKKHNNINKLVIEKSKVWSGEEKASMYNGFRTYMSHKLPLTNSAGKNVGLLGISVDISDTRKKEELRLKLKAQKELYSLAQQVAHDIASPVTSLKMVEYLSAEKLLDKEKEMLELAIESIEEMSNKLIEKYQVSKDEEAGIVRQAINRSEEMYIAPYLGLLEVIGSYVYRDNKNIKYYPDEKNKFVFIRGDYSDFCRMIINIINNGIEAVEGKKGEIEVKYKVKGEEVKIVVKDNGKGMPKEIVERIKNNEEVGTTKETGHGIGTQQIMDTIKAMKGKVEIESKEGEGTEFILTFPKSEKPIWFADKIELKKGDTVVILDDEESMHEIWKEVFKKYEEEITVTYFTKGLETIEYINSLKDKRKVLLLTKYELKGQEVNGIGVVEKSNMKDRHIIITRLHLSKIKEFNEKNGFLKIFSRSLLKDAPISIC